MTLIGAFLTDKAGASSMRLALIIGLVSSALLILIYTAVATVGQ